MVYIPTVLALVAVLSPVYGMPLSKRISQTISDSTQSFVKACRGAGGGEKCNNISVNAFQTLLAAAKPCDQQDAADQMIDLAKTLNSDPDMIKFAQIFAQQPRNTPTSQAVQYCQEAPKNAELNGLFQCQFEGADQTTFVGGVAVGGAGTIPFGQSKPLSPPGSCPANPDGPIPDGVQLDTLTQDPGVAGAEQAAPADTAAITAASADTAATVTATASVVATVAATTAPAASSAAAASAKVDFHLQNGEDAQALNAQFATLTADSPCTDGEQACVAGAFAQCAGGRFISTACSGGSQCFALPLVNKAGTSLACTTSGDTLARIQATGATGGITGN